MEEEQGMLTVVKEWRRMKRELRRVERELGRMERERRRIKREIRRREMQKQKIERQTQGRKRNRGSKNTVNQIGNSKISIIEGEEAQRERRKEALLTERDLRELHSKAKIGDTVRGTPEANVFRHKYFAEMSVARKMLDNAKLKIHEEQRLLEEHRLLQESKALEESGFSSGGKLGTRFEGSVGTSLGGKLKQQYTEPYQDHHMEHYAEHYTKQSIRKNNDMQQLQGNFEQQLRISGARESDGFSDLIFGSEKDGESRDQIIMQQQLIEEKNQIEENIDSVEDDNDDVTVLRDEDEFIFSAIHERLDSVEDFLREEGWIEVNRSVSMRKESEKDSERFAIQEQLELNLRTSTMLKQTKQKNQAKPQKLTTLSETMQRVVQGLLVPELVPSCQRKGSANSSSENEPDSPDIKRAKRRFQNAHALSSLRKEGRANTSKAQTNSNTSCSPAFDDSPDVNDFSQKDKIQKTFSELNSRSPNINYIQSETPTSIKTPTFPPPNPMFLAEMSVHDFYNWAFVDSTPFVSRTVVKLLRLLMREELADRATRAADPQFSSNKARQKTGLLSNKQVIYEFSNSY